MINTNHRILRYQITKEKILIYKKSKTEVRISYIIWSIIFVLFTFVALGFSEEPFFLSLTLIPLAAILYITINKNKKIVFDIVNKQVIVEQSFSKLTYNGNEIYNFEKVNSITSSDFYIMLLKKDKYGQGIKLTPQVVSIKKDGNTYIQEFESKILPSILKIIEHEI